MNEHELIWVRDRFEDRLQIEPKDYRQYIALIDETTAEKLFYDPHTTKIMEALEKKSSQYLNCVSSSQTPTI